MNRLRLQELIEYPTLGILHLNSESVLQSLLNVNTRKRICRDGVSPINSVSCANLLFYPLWTSTNLVKFTKNAISVVEAVMQRDIIYTDFSKAFDTISHKLLISKSGHIQFYLIGMFRIFFKERSTSIIYLVGYPKRLIQSQKFLMGAT